MSSYEPTEEEVRQFSKIGNLVIRAQLDYNYDGIPGIYFITEGCGCCSRRILLTETNSKEVDQILDHWERKLGAQLAHIEHLRNSLEWHGFQAMLNEL